MKMMMMVLLVLLQGCASYTAFTGIVRTEGALVADKQMEATLFFLCKGVTVGAWVRRFGENKQSAEAWSVMCSNKSLAPPPLP